MSWKTLFLIPGIVFAAIAVAKSQRPPTPEKFQETVKQLRTIFRSEGTWDKGFGTTVQFMPAWTKINEPSVTVFRDKIVGAKPYADTKEARAEASEAVKKLHQALNSPVPKFNPMFSEVFRVERPGSPPSFKVELFESFGDDDSIRVGWRTPPGSTFPKDLHMSELRARLGEPQRTTKQVLRSEDGEGRPLVLKLHHYAEGAVIFVESNLSARPGTVDRILFDIPTLTKAVFEER